MTSTFVNPRFGFDDDEEDDVYLDNDLGVLSEESQEDSGSGWGMPDEESGFATGPPPVPSRSPPGLPPRNGLVASRTGTSSGSDGAQLVSSPADIFASYGGGGGVKPGHTTPKSTYSGSFNMQRVSESEFGLYPKTWRESTLDFIHEVRNENGLKRRLVFIAGGLALACAVLIGTSIGTGGAGRNTGPDGNPTLPVPNVPGGTKHTDSEPQLVWKDGPCPETTESSEGWIKHGEIACQPLELYTKRQLEFAVTQLQDGVDGAVGAGAIPGSLQAGLDKRENPCPDYQFTWARDQAVVYSAMTDRYLVEQDSTFAEKLKNYLVDYAKHAHSWYILNVVEEEEENYAKYALAYAKVTFEGKGVKAWCNPQNDGPALRAIQLMRFADAVYEKEGEVEGKRILDEFLYKKGTLDETAMAPIKRDLEWLHLNYDIEDCEPWEEIKGKHFYDRIVAYTALKRGAAFARKLGETDLADAWDAKADEDRAKINEHWKEASLTIQPEKDNRGNRLDDIQTTYAMAHAYLTEDDFFGPGDTRMMANALYTLRSFNAYWKINEIGWMGHHDMGPAIGRYVHDTYGGGCTVPIEVCPEGGGWRSTCRGNAWHLATSAMAEFFYRVVNHYKEKGSIIVDKYNINTFYWFGAKSILGEVEEAKLPLNFGRDSAEYKALLTTLIHAGDSFLKRNKFHTNAEMVLYEQFNGVSGAQHSTAGLTWSYAAVMTAIEQRDQLNPRALLQEEFALGNDEVLLDVVATQVPSHGDAFTPVLLFNGETDCAKGYPLGQRRKVNHIADWSTFIHLKTQTIHKVRVGAMVKLADAVKCEISELETEIKTFQTNPIEPVFVEWKCDDKEKCPEPELPSKLKYKIIVDASNPDGTMKSGVESVEILGGVPVSGTSEWDETYSSIITWTPCEGMKGIRSKTHFIFEFEMPVEAEKFEYQLMPHGSGACEANWLGISNTVVDMSQYESPGIYLQTLGSDTLIPSG